MHDSPNEKREIYKPANLHDWITAIKAFRDKHQLSENDQWAISMNYHILALLETDQMVECLKDFIGLYHRGIIPQNQETVDLMTRSWNLIRDL